MKQFKASICKYSHAFYLPGSELSTITGFHDNIPTGDSPPVYRSPYRKSPSELAAIKDELQIMLKLHIIRPSFSSWGAPCILVGKPQEKDLPQPPRFVVDYRGVNIVTTGDGYPIPSVSNVLDALSGGKKFAKLDMASGYWQVLVNPAHLHKTAFATHLGLYDFLRMPYGLRTAPQTFQRILNSVFADFLCTVYHMIFIGGTCINMSEPGFAVAPNVFVSSPSSPLMVPCSLGFTNTLFTPLVLTMLVNFLLFPQVINGSLLQYVPTPIIFVLSQFLTKLQPLQLMPYFMMFFSN